VTGFPLICLYLLTIALRIPRIKERWVAPLLRGPEWFFEVAVPLDFLQGPGAAILRNYRWRLFIPWGIEGLTLAALGLTGHVSEVSILIMISAITLFTRFNYYAARIVIENRTRLFERPEASQPASNVVLSLQPRTLAAYTGWWVEAGIILALSAAAIWSVFLPATNNPAIERRLLSMMVIDVYAQAGLLLIKYGIIRSGGAAPVDNVEQYLAWRESLRRFTTGFCDLTRLLFSLKPLLVISVIVGGSTLLAAEIGFFIVSIAAIGLGWRSRLAYLKVASRTRPAKFPLLPAAQEARGPVGFWPSLPVLLLKTANGYALNLASTQVGIAGLYSVGFAGLWMWLLR
jgi:hypothetical protein